MTGSATHKNDLAALSRPVWPSLVAVAVISCVINLLYLVTPLYMLQIYDRILVSGSRETLVFLSLAAVGGLVTLAVLDHLRKVVLFRIGSGLDAVVTGRFFGAAGDRPVAGLEARSVLRDIQILRATVSGPAALLPFDLPWLILFTGVLFLLHPVFGMLAVLVTASLVVLAFANLAATRARARSGEPSRVEAPELPDRASRFGQATRAMGLLPGFLGKWRYLRETFDTHQVGLGELGSAFQAAARGLRMIAQLGVLGLGALLVLDGQLSAGAMIAGSILLGRALAPAETLFQVWPVLGAARKSRRALDARLADLHARPAAIRLPAPRGRVSAENAAIGRPGARRPLLRGLNFSIKAGETLALIGPSGSGKSVLCRALAGEGTVLSGTLRLDSAALDQWPDDQFAQAVGYDGPDISLIPGTVRENISRFQECGDKAVIEAASLAGIHEAVLAIGDGYNSPIEEGGTNLPAGLAGGIALARAVFSSPAVVVLDEPFSQLDQAGEARTLRAIEQLKAAGVTVVVATHRQTILPLTDKIVMLRDCRQELFGPRSEVTNILQERQRFASRTSASDLSQGKVQ